LVVLEKKYVGKVVDRMTRGSCISTNSMKSGDDDSVLFIILGLGHMLNRIRPILHTGWLK